MEASAQVGSSELGALEDALGQGAKGLIDVDPVLGFVTICFAVAAFVLWRENGKLRTRIETYLQEQAEYERTGRREAEQKIDRLLDAIDGEPRRSRRQ